MRIFLTGATGFIGSEITRELLANGHKVLGLARSDAGAEALTAAGVDVQRGDLEDLDSLRSGAAAADGVIHTAFVHDFSRYMEAGGIEQRAVTALGEALVGSGKPLVITSGTAAVTSGVRATEEMAGDPASAGAARVAAETIVLELAQRGVRSAVMRLPPTVHDAGDHGFVPALIGIARQKGVSAYLGDGANRWPAVNRKDAARLFRLAAERAPAGTVLH
ncbi:MAG: SDR family oxidoreductase, partial [Rhodospirillaceae bacterium]|nr:SDR family oxidoreductase [Rhodospirillaceae bacterium]